MAADAQSVSDGYWTVSYTFKGTTFWAVGGLLGWCSTDEWTSRGRLDEAAAREVFAVFKKNKKNRDVRLVRVTRRPKVSHARIQRAGYCNDSVRLPPTALRLLREHAAGLRNDVPDGVGPGVTRMRTQMLEAADQIEAWLAATEPGGAT